MEVEQKCINMILSETKGGTSVYRNHVYIYMHVSYKISTFKFF